MSDSRSSPRPRHLEWPLLAAKLLHRPAKQATVQLTCMPVYWPDRSPPRIRRTPLASPGSIQNDWQRSCKCATTRKTNAELNWIAKRRQHCVPISSDKCKLKSSRGEGSAYTWTRKFCREKGSLESSRRIRSQREAWRGDHRLVDISERGNLTDNEVRNLQKIEYNLWKDILRRKFSNKVPN